MELVTHNITWPSRRNHKPVVIAPIGDIQWSGKRGSTAGDILKRHIDKCMKLDAWFVGTGDFIDFMCVDLSTRILTKNGWKRHDEVQIGDLVAAYDGHGLVWTPLRAIHRHDRAPLVKMESKSFLARVTSAHTWWTRKWGLQMTKGLKGRAANLVIVARAVDGESVVTPDEAWLLGWLVTDGHISWRTRDNFSILQSKLQYVEELRSRLAGIVRREGVSAGGLHYFDLQLDVVRAVFWRAEVDYKTLEGFDRLPLRLSQAAREAMLDAMLKAEGSFHASVGRVGNWRFSQSVKKNPVVVETFVNLCTMEGLRLGRSRPKPNGVWTPRILTRKEPTTYDMRFTSDGVESVWCPETDFGTWVMRQGDQICITGNSPSNRQRFKAAALYDCVTEDVRALTRYGWKYYKDLMIGEEIFGYDLKIRQTCWTRVLDIKVWKHAPTIRMRSRNWDWTVTDNHRWVAEYPDGSQRLTPTYALHQGRHKIVVAAPCVQGGEAAITSDEAMLLGWIITDGHVKFPECWTTYISQTKRRYVQEIRRLIRRLGIYCSETVCQPSGAHKENAKPWHRFGLSAPEVRHIFDRAGVHNDTDLPKMAALLSVRARETMLDAMGKAEGGPMGSGTQFDQKPGPRLDLYLALAAFIGKRTRKGNLKRDGVVRTGMTGKRYYWPQLGHWERSPKNEMPLMTVWCPVTETGTWVARNGNQVSITGNSAEDVVDDAALELVHELYENYLKPTKGRWLGLCHGHHWAQLRTGDTTDMRLCQMLGAKFLGTCAYIRLVFRSNGSRFSIVLFVHHGCGGGMKMSAPLNKIENLLPYWDADVFLLGHSTKQAAAPVNRIMPRWHGFGARDLVHRKIYMVGCGGFSKSYVEGAKQGQIPMGNYVEQRLLSPASLGAPLIKIVPIVKYRRYGPRKEGRGSSTWEPDVTVEL